VALRESDLYGCYQRLERPLFNVLYRMLWNQQDCQDLIQEAFLRIWKRRKHVDTKRLDGLIWTAALNLARNRLRWRWLWRSEPMDADWPDSRQSPEALAERFSQQKRLHAALARLPTALRDVILLAEFSDLSQAAISATLKIPRGTVASRRHHALKKLRLILSETDHD